MGATGNLETFEDEPRQSKTCRHLEPAKLRHLLSSLVPAETRGTFLLPAPAHAQNDRVAVKNSSPQRRQADKSSALRGFVRRIRGPSSKRHEH